MSDAPKSECRYPSGYCLNRDEIKRLRKNINLTEEKLVVIRDSTYRDAVTLRAMAAAALEALREAK